MNKFLPFVIALLLHALPLSYFLFKQRKADDMPIATGNSRPQGIDLSGFSTYKNYKKRSTAQKASTTKTAAIESTSQSTNSGSAPVTGSSPSTGNGTGTGIGTDTSGGSASVGESIYLSTVDPVYPQLARQKGIEGKVKLRAHYSEGIITQIEVVESSGTKMLDESAKKALQRWKLKPGLSGKFEKTFQFKLN